jgi:hypothetical protein
MWIIDWDADPSGPRATNANAVGLTSANWDKDMACWCTKKFRMSDDDGNILYKGRSTDNNSERAFDPLDDFGAPNAGCTKIEYLRDYWEVL